MRIRPEHRWLYPIDWPELSRAIRFGRAKMSDVEPRAAGRNRRTVPLGDGRWWDEAKATWCTGDGRILNGRPAPGPYAPVTRVVLAAAHLDHDPTNNRPGNLKALCQRCRILHDREEHVRRRWLTYRMRKALGDLFAGAYQVR